jgi:hypothetical protein
MFELSINSALDSPPSNRPRLGLSLGYEDLDEGRRSLRKLSALDFQGACFGHGKPILKDAALEFRRLWA